jgi:hypothetical protein
LYYDEAVSGGLAKDFITGHLHPPMSNVQLFNVFGHPFPLFVQSYYGALKSWLLIPPVAVCGATVSVLRLTSLVCALVALLFFVLGVRLWLGLSAAIVAGALFVTDPTCFFLSLLDWGPAIPPALVSICCIIFRLGLVADSESRLSVVCRFFLGLGLFHKADFVAFLAGTGIAVACFYGKQLFSVLRARPSLIAMCALGFLLGAGLMIWRLPQIVASTCPRQVGFGQLKEKLPDLGHALRWLLHRAFDELRWLVRPDVQTFLECSFIALVCSANCDGCATRDLHFPSEKQGTTRRWMSSTWLRTDHRRSLCHARRRANSSRNSRLPVPATDHRSGVHISLAAKIKQARATRNGSSHLCCATSSARKPDAGSQKNGTITSETGGRGWWSNVFDDFCRQNAARTDLTIVSLDWGFNEQLAFLTNGPKLLEPFWAFTASKEALPDLPRDPQYVYLAHSPEYSLLRYDLLYLNAARSDNHAEIQSYSDRQGQIVFYAIRFREQ